MHVLRSHNDQEAIKIASEHAKNVIIVGAGFIGSESASSLKLKYKDAMNVHVVSLESVPMERIFGVEVGKMFVAEHEKNGVKMHTSRKVVEIKGDG